MRMNQQGSLENKLVVLIGGSGFVGSYLAQELLQKGARLRIADLHPDRAARLKPLANLGQIQAVPCDATKKNTVAAAVHGADAVVYLASAAGEKERGANAVGAGYAAEAAAAAGASSFVYLSALGAKAESANSLLATKAEGEARVQAAFPNATIVRPAILFGENDRFINAIAEGVEKQGWIGVIGSDTKVQPVLVDDVAAALATALADPESFGGQTLELAGPETLSVKELHLRIAKAQDREAKLLDVPAGLANLATLLPVTTLSGQQWQQIKDAGLAADAGAGFAQLGLTARPLSLFLDRWMVRYCRNGRFAHLNKVAQ